MRLTVSPGGTAVDAGAQAASGDDDQSGAVVRHRRLLAV
jgi:hypothetical protein